MGLKESNFNYWCGSFTNPLEYMITHYKQITTDADFKGISNVNNITFFKKYFSYDQLISTQASKTFDEMKNSMYSSDNYDYTIWGGWENDTEVFNDIDNASNASLQWHIGQKTYFNDMPKSGSAVYNGDIKGYTLENRRELVGNISIGVDFAGTAQSDINGIDGSIIIKETVANGGAVWDSFEFKGDINRNEFTAKHVNGYTGEIQGQFNGPNAEEMSGTWERGNGVESADGVFRAKR